MRPTLLLLLVFLAVAVPARAAGPEIGVADDRILMVGGEQADRVVAEWQAQGGGGGRGVTPSARRGGGGGGRARPRPRGRGWGQRSARVRGCEVGGGRLRGARHRPGGRRAPPA